jgi:hypothetical protein
MVTGGDADWDDAAHGTATTILEVEAFASLTQLLRLKRPMIGIDTIVSSQGPKFLAKSCLTRLVKPTPHAQVGNLRLKSKGSRYQKHIATLHFHPRAHIGDRVIPS